MKCNSCNSEWTTNSSRASSMTVCPFCGAPLETQASRQSGTLADVLKEIAARFGTGTLRDGFRTLGLFADLAPELTREKNQLNLFVNCGGPGALWEVRGADDAARDRAVETLIRKLTDEYFLAENAARSVCETWLAALGNAPVVTAAPRKTAPAEPDVAQYLRNADACAKDDVQGRISWLGKAAEAGDLTAQIRLGKEYYDLHYDGGGNPENRRNGIKWFTKAALAGGGKDPGEVCFQLHELLLEDCQNEKGFYWCKKAAELGHRDAQQYLAEYYDEGFTVEADPEQAEYWRQQRVQSFIDESLRFAHAAETDEEFIHWVKQAGEWGDLEAQLILGDIYFAGDIAQKRKDAIYWYTKAAEQGGGENAAETFYRLAILLLQEEPPQSKLAARWCIKAAELDHSAAQFVLSKMYMKGNGVRQDYSSATKWLFRSAELGNRRAKAFINDLMGLAADPK